MYACGYSSATACTPGVDAIRVISLTGLDGSGRSVAESAVSSCKYSSHEAKHSEFELAAAAPEALPPYSKLE